MANKNLKPKTYNPASSAGRLQPSPRNLSPRLIGGQATTPPHHRASYHPASSAGRLQPNRGFAMLFSVLISSLLVVIGLSIFSITLKELTISTSSRESQMAFYAANSGMECALYWDLIGGRESGIYRSAFASTTVQAEINSAKTVPAVCNTVTVNSATSATTIFNFYVNDPSDFNGPCANVTVEKRKITENGIDKIETTIESRGKNICGTSGRRVERGLKATIITNM